MRPEGETRLMWNGAGRLATNLEACSFPTSIDCSYNLEESVGCIETLDPRSMASSQRSQAGSAVEPKRAVPLSSGLSQLTRGSFAIVTSGYFLPSSLLLLRSSAHLRALDHGR